MPENAAPQPAAPDHRPRARSWHWYSTPSSTDRLEISILALFETVLAVAVYAWLVLNGLTVILVSSACIAPFLLLRTPLSVELALTKGEAIAMKKAGVSKLAPLVGVLDYAAPLRLM